MTHPYADRRYAEAFGDGYVPLYLPNAGVHVLKRPIPGTDSFDAMGPYPLTPMHPQANLAEDFAVLQAMGIVSLVLVSDPFQRPELAQLQAAFDRATLHKEHFIYDFAAPKPYTKHHRASIARATRDCVARVIDLTDHLDAWYALYRCLIEKHGITGLQAFPQSYFTALCALQPITVGAFMGDELVSAHLWFRNNHYVYSHLAASNAEGYRIGAAYAVYDRSLAYFAETGACLLDFGAGAGAHASADGLVSLKRGFSTGVVPCYLCGKIIDPEKYAQLRAGKETNFFPAYREA